MIVGFNHNISYRGTVFHVQTEDSGLKNPQLVTLLYHGGSIISSKKTVYADIIKVDNLEQVVEELAKEQHKGMLKRLTSGEFDVRIADYNIPLEGQAAKGAAVRANEPSVVAEPEPATVVPEDSTQDIEDSTSELSSAGFAGEELGHDVIITEEEPRVDKFRKKEPESMSLDELVYAYLTAGR